MLRFAFGLLIGLGGASALAAQDAKISRDANYECAFDTECVDAETCVATDYALTITLVAEGASEADLTAMGSLSSDAVTVPLFGSIFDGTLSLFSFGMQDFYLLTAASTGTARLSYHEFAGPTAVTYLGQCTSK